MTRTFLLVLVFLMISVSTWARGGGGCFLAGTPTLLENGAEIPIEQVRKGDRVWSLDGDTVVGSTVTNTYSRTVEGYYELSIGAIKIYATGEHPFATTDGAFKTVRDLRVGDTLRSFNNGKLAWVRLDSIQFQPRATSVYNLEVAGPHTYFVSGIAVHNKGGFGGGAHFGGGFHFGGSSGGHYYGSSGGGSIDGTTLFWFVVIIVLIGGTIFFFEYRDRTSTTSESTAGKLDFKIDPVRAGQKHQETLAVLKQICAKTPEFEPGRLEEQFKEVFRRLQECWTLRDYGPLDQFLTKNLMSQHRKQLDGQRRAHEINKIDQLEILGLWFFQVVFTPKETSEITVLFQARARDYYVDDRDGRILRGDSYPESFQEFWVFRWSGQTWLLASIQQVSDQSKAWKPNRIEQSAMLNGDFVSIDSMSRAEKRLRLLSQASPIWSPETLREQISLWCSELVSARETGKIEGLRKSDFEESVWANIDSEIKARIQRNETMIQRNFCVREIVFVLVRSEDQGKNEVLVRVSTHSMNELRRGDRLLSLDSDIQIRVENWLIRLVEGTWVVQSIKKAV